MRKRPGSRGSNRIAWAETQKPATLLVIRLLIVANATVLTVVAGLYLAFASWPAGGVVAGFLLAVVVALLVLLPHTDPRRGWNSRW